MPWPLRQEVQLDPIRFAGVPLRIAATRPAERDEIRHSSAPSSLAVLERVVVVALVWRLELGARQPRPQGRDYFRTP